MAVKLADINTSNIKIRWTEPYVSDGLNKKFAEHHGIVRGFIARPSPTGGLNIRLDLYGGLSIAHVRTTNFHTATIVIDQPIDVSLLAFANQRCVVALKVVYTIAGSSSAQIDAMLESDYATYAGANDHVALVLVDVPIAGSNVERSDILGIYTQFDESVRGDSWSPREDERLIFTAPFGKAMVGTKVATAVVACDNNQVNTCNSPICYLMSQSVAPVDSTDRSQIIGEFSLKRKYMTTVGDDLPVYIKVSFDYKITTKLEPFIPNLNTSGLVASILWMAAGPYKEIVSKVDHVDVMADYARFTTIFQLEQTSDVNFNVIPDLNLYVGLRCSLGEVYIDNVEITQYSNYDETLNKMVSDRETFREIHVRNKTITYEGPALKLYAAYPNLYLVSGNRYTGGNLDCTLHVVHDDVTKLCDFSVDAGDITASGDVNAGVDVNAINDVNAGNDLNVTHDAVVHDNLTVDDLATVGTFQSNGYTLMNRDVTPLIPCHHLKGVTWIGEDVDGGAPENGIALDVCANGTKYYLLSRLGFVQMFAPPAFSDCWGAGTYNGIDLFSPDVFVPDATRPYLCGGHAVGIKHLDTLKIGAVNYYPEAFNGDFACFIDHTTDQLATNIFGNNVFDLLVYNTHARELTNHYVSLDRLNAFAVAPDEITGDDVTKRRQNGVDWTCADELIPFPPATRFQSTPAVRNSTNTNPAAVANFVTIDVRTIPVGGHFKLPRPMWKATDFNPPQTSNYDVYAYIQFIVECSIPALGGAPGTNAILYNYQLLVCDDHSKYVSGATVPLTSLILGACVGAKYNADPANPEVVKSVSNLLVPLKFHAGGAVVTPNPLTFSLHRFYTYCEYTFDALWYDDSVAAPGVPAEVGATVGVVMRLLGFKVGHNFFDLVDPNIIHRVP